MSLISASNIFCVKFPRSPIRMEQIVQADVACGSSSTNRFSRNCSLIVRDRPDDVRMAASLLCRSRVTCVVPNVGLVTLAGRMRAVGD